MLAKEIEDKAFALNAGQYTQPIRTKQGFIILQATQHNLGGEGSFKQVEPQVEEALFLERMQPKLREYLTQLREEAAIDIKPGAVDTGASGNEMHLTYSAYTPPAEKKKKKFARTRFRGKTRSTPVQTAKTATPAADQTATAATPAAAASPTAATTPATTPATTQQASNNDQNVQKPGKREKIRFGQAPRESLPSSQVATAVAPDNTPAVTTPENTLCKPGRYGDQHHPDRARTQDPPEQPADGAQGKENEVYRYPGSADCGRTGDTEGAECTVRTG